MSRTAPLCLSRRTALLLGAAALFASAAAHAAPPVNTLKPGLFGGRTDTAILGYDPVAYFSSALKRSSASLMKPGMSFFHVACTSAS